PARNARCRRDRLREGRGNPAGFRRAPATSRIHRRAAKAFGAVGARPCVPAANRRVRGCRPRRPQARVIRLRRIRCAMDAVGSSGQAHHRDERRCSLVSYVNYICIYERGHNGSRTTGRANAMGDEARDAAGKPAGNGMRRRDFLCLSVLVPLSALAACAEVTRPAPLARTDMVPDGRPHRFGFAARQFMLDDAPFTIRSGEMHPIRIPREYWRHRIRMAKAMGLNTISLYVMWNALESEPGVFDLTTDRRDFARFIRICQDEGMWVYLRPGPYICGEWDFGGLPPYLLRHPRIRVRDRDDPDYMAAVRRYIATVAPVVQPLMAANGGPVLMLQIENEYASFGHDLGYLEALRALWRQHGIDGPFSISDGLDQVRKARTCLPGAALGLDGDTDFAAAQVIAGELPVWMGEGYPGWLTHWGDKDFARGDF